MHFWKSIQVVFLLGFISIPIAASAAAIEEDADVRAWSGENGVARGMEVDGAPGGDGEDQSHAIFV